ncbi:MAG TPA: AraC family transcriptional regulator [Blastocatellia bacterium]|nr:AraC family transcriptional regulator [Blastocatellia bacterium]
MSVSRKSSDSASPTQTASPTKLRSYNTAPCGAGVVLSTPPVGTLELPASPALIVSMHVGEAAVSSCRRGGQTHFGTTVHGDINIIPPGTPSKWEIQKANDTALVVWAPPTILEAAASEAGVELGRVDIRNVFGLRDHQLQAICFALKAELGSGATSGRLYTDSLVTAITARVLSRFSSLQGSFEQDRTRGLSGYSLKRLLAYLESNLDLNLSLRDIAAFAGLSTSHLKTVFRQSVGLPIHEYVIHRRLDRAKNLLADSSRSITEIALECGFAHQSHMARHMRRLLGVSPREFRRISKPAR